MGERGLRGVTGREWARYQTNTILSNQKLTSVMVLG